MLLLFVRLSPVWLFFLLSFFLLAQLSWRGLFRCDFCLLWMFATVVTGMAFIVIGEASGSLELLTQRCVLASWLAMDLGLGAALLWLSRTGAASVSAMTLTRSRQWWRHFSAQNIAIKSLLLASLAFWLLLGLFAVKTPTTVWDCETYHMPRIMHWLQQRSLRHYQTNIPRQLESAPGAEIATAQLILLAGDDTPASLIEWWALLTGAIAAAFLSRELLAITPKKGIPADPSAPELCFAFVLLMAMTLPEAAGESVTPQNNVVAAMWTAVTVALGAKLLLDRRLTICLFGSAAALALGISVKATVLIYAAPFVALGLACLAWQRAWSAAWRWGAAALFLVLALDGPWMSRNETLFHNPLGPKSTYAAQRIAHNSPKKVVVNVIRNLSLYTRSPSEIATTLADFSMDAAIRFMGESLDDTNAVFPSTSFLPNKKAVIKRGEGWGNCYTLLLLFLAVAIYPFRFKVFSPLGACLVAAMAAFILFCGYLRYQPWHPRLHLACFLMATPFIGAVLCWWFDRWVALLVGAFLLANVLLTMSFNSTVPVWQALRPSQSREDLYFAGRGDFRVPTVLAVDNLVRSGCASVLLKVSDDSWEYPFWALLKDRGFHGAIQHVAVENASAVLPMAPYVLESSALVSDVRTGSIAHFFPWHTNYGPWKISYPQPAAISP